MKDTDLITVIGCRRLPIDYRGTVCGQPGYTNEQTVKTPDGMLPESMVDMFLTP